jgi:hypothetical protein
MAYTVYVMGSSKDGRMSIEQFYPVMGDKVEAHEQTPYTKEEIEEKRIEAINRMNQIKQYQNG